MPNPNAPKTAADLDLSGIPGIEGLDIPGVTSPAPRSETGSEDSGFAPAEPSEPVDYSQFTGGDQPPAAPEPQGSGPAAEPAAPEPGLWDQLLAQVPEVLHQELRPTLDEYQRQISRRDEQLERYVPFQEWVDRGLTPQDIVMALQTQQQILSDPRGYWQGLGDRFGWNVPQQVVYQPPPQQAQQAQPRGEFDDIFGEPQQPAQPQPGQQQLPPELQQAMQEAQRARQEIQSWRQQQQQQQIIEQGRARIAQELDALEQRYGAFDRDEVQRRAFVNAQTGGTPSLTDAFHQMKDYENQITRRYAAQRPQAPQIIGGGNGAPPPPQLDLSTPEARSAAAFQLAIQMGADNPNGGYRA